MEKEKLKNTDNGDFILKRKEYLHFFCFNLLLFWEHPKVCVNLQTDVR